MNIEHDAERLFREARWFQVIDPQIPIGDQVIAYGLQFRGGLRVVEPDWENQPEAIKEVWRRKVVRGEAERLAGDIQKSRMEGRRFISDFIDDGIDAFGKKVPVWRPTIALTHLKALGVDDAVACINRAVAAIERDQPQGALNPLLEHLDLKDALKALEILCTAEKPKAKKA